MNSPFWRYVMTGKSLRMTSYEPENAYSPRTITLRGSVSCGERDDYFWAEVDPVFDPPALGLVNSLSLILLAPRFVGDAISKSANWPLHVYVCRTRKTPAGSKEVPADDVQILNWGLLEPRPITRSDALRIAKDECVRLGWPLNEHMTVKRGVFCFTVWGGGRKGGNLCMKIRKKDGAILQSSLTPR